MSKNCVFRVPDEVLHYVVPADGRPGDLNLYVIEDELFLVRNGLEVLAGRFSGTTPIDILGAPNVANSLTIQDAIHSPALGGGLRFVGGSTGFDTLVLDDGAADSVVHRSQTAASGEFELDGLVIRYESVESVTDFLAGSISIPNTPLVEGSEFAFAASGLALTGVAAELISWTVSRDGIPAHSDVGPNGRFTPRDNGTYEIEFAIAAENGPVAKTRRTIQNRSSSAQITRPQTSFLTTFWFSRTSKVR